MNILITGGLGYIGSYLYVYLHSQPKLIKNVILLDNLVNSSFQVLKNLQQITKTSIKFFNYDLVADYEKILEIFELYNIDTIIHCAGLKSVGESINFPLAYYENNLISLINLLKVMEKTKCYNLIFSSSATVYGNQQPPFVETMTTGIGTSNPYGRTKYFQEEILKDISKTNKNFKIVVLRYFNPIGEHSSGLLVEKSTNIFPHIASVARDVARGLVETPFLKIFGDGLCVRDFIDIEDLCDAHFVILKNFSIGITIYNIGTGEGKTVLDLVAAFEKANCVVISKKFVEPREGDLPVMYSNCDKIKNELGWVAKKSLIESCKINISQLKVD